MKAKGSIFIGIVALGLLAVGVYYFVRKQKAEAEAAKAEQQAQLLAAAAKPETNKNDVYVAGITAGGAILSSITNLFRPSIT